MADELQNHLPIPVAAKRDLAARHAARAAHKKSTSTRGFRRVPLVGDPLSISASYFMLRAGLAIVSFFYPVVLVLGSMLLDRVGLSDVQTSLSAYYHFRASSPCEYGSGTMRNVFVGVLWAVGAFLVLYRGYSRKEDVALDIAGLAAVVVAICPMDWPVDHTCARHSSAIASAARTLTAKVHFASAATFFAMIAYVCVRRADDTVSILADDKRQRRFRKVYAALGIWMLGTPMVILLLSYIVGNAASSYKILLVEIAGVWVFSIFWLVKTYEILLIERE